MSMLKLSLLVAIAPLCLGVVHKPESPEKVPYPEGYRRWTHVRSGLTGPESPDYEVTGPHDQSLSAKGREQKVNGGPLTAA